MARNPQIATVTDEATGKDYAIRLSDTVKAGVRSVRFYADWNLGPVVTDTFAA